KLPCQLFVDLCDPELDVGLDVLGDDLTGLDDVAEELAQRVAAATAGAGVFLIDACGVERLIEPGIAVEFGRRGGPGGGPGLCFVRHGQLPSVFGASSPLTPICFARAIAFSVLLSTSPSSASSLSLPSILERSSTSFWRIWSNSLSAGTWAATLAG